MDRDAPSMGQLRAAISSAVERAERTRAESVHLVATTRSLSEEYHRRRRRAAPARVDTGRS